MRAEPLCGHLGQQDQGGLLGEGAGALCADGGGHDLGLPRVVKEDPGLGDVQLHALLAFFLQLRFGSPARVQ